MTDNAIPQATAAHVHILHEGYVRETAGGDRVGSTVTLILDGAHVIVVDPGMVPHREVLLDALAALEQRGNARVTAAGYLIAGKFEMERQNFGHGHALGHGHGHEILAPHLLRLLTLTRMS